MGIPQVSVVIPLFNKEKYVGRAIESVLGQTFQDFELIVVDDGSTDKGPEIVKKFHDSRIKLTDQPNCGVSVARNRGIAEARADLIAFLDADDEWRPTFLETIWKLRRLFPDTKVFATGYRMYRRARYLYVPNFKIPKVSTLSLSRYISCCINSNVSPISSSSVAVEKQTLKEIGAFPACQAHGEDLDTWFRLLERFTAAYYNEPLATYWQGLPDSVSITTGGSAILEALENNSRLGVFTEQAPAEILDYIAWRRSSAIKGLIIGGNATEARQQIRLIWRSPKFRAYCIKSYCLSYLPICLVRRFLHLREALLPYMNLALRS